MKIYLVIYQSTYREYRARNFRELNDWILSDMRKLGDPKVIYLLREE